MHMVIHCVPHGACMRVSCSAVSLFAWLGHACKVSCGVYALRLAQPYPRLHILHCSASAPTPCDAWTCCAMDALACTSVHVPAPRRCPHACGHANAYGCTCAHICVPRPRRCNGAAHPRSAATAQLTAVMQRSGKVTVARIAAAPASAEICEPAL
jgi:hypothetical protein